MSSNAPQLYEEDFVRWTEQQSRALRDDWFPGDAPTTALSPRAGRGGDPRNACLPQVLVEEGGDRVEGRARRAGFVGDIDDVDIAARLAVVRDEPLGLVAREI
jgi:hypothetical protein